MLHASILLTFFPAECVPNRRNLRGGRGPFLLLAVVFFVAMRSILHIFIAFLPGTASGGRAPASFWSTRTVRYSDPAIPTFGLILPPSSVF